MKIECLPHQGFEASLIFVTKTRAYPCEDEFWDRIHNTLFSS